MLVAPRVSASRAARFGVERGGLILTLRDEVCLLGAGVAVALDVELPVLQAALEALGLGVDLAEGGAGVGGLAVGVAALVGLAVEVSGEGGDLVLQLGGAVVGGVELGGDGVDLLLDFVQLALEGERALRAGAAAGDGDIVEDLAGGGEEEGVRVFERERASGLGVGRDEAVAQLGQDDLERFAEAVADARCSRSGEPGPRAAGASRRAHAVGEGELGLRVVGVDEEGRAAGDIVL